MCRSNNVLFGEEVSIDVVYSYLQNVCEKDGKLLSCYSEIENALYSLHN